MDYFQLRHPIALLELNPSGGGHGYLTLTQYSGLAGVIPGHLEDLQDIMTLFMHSESSLSTYHDDDFYHVEELHPYGPLSPETTLITNELKVTTVGEVRKLNGTPVDQKTVKHENTDG